MSDLFDIHDDKMGVDVPKEKRYLNTTSYDYSVDYLVELMNTDDPKIILAVPFQRKFVWKEDRASQLIESVIMNVPIPPLYFAEEENNKWLVIDGLQRLHAILRFFQNEYPLKGMEIIKELEGLKYKDLPPKSKDLLKDGLMRINVIKKDSHPDIKYDIFMRLNKGAVSLNYQELRNCLYRGAFNDALKTIVGNNTDFLKIFNLKKPHQRFQDIEFIVRYFAIKENLVVNNKGYSVKGYNGKMVNFLNEFMNSKTKMTTIEAESYTTEFNNLIKKVLIVFTHEDAFRDPTADNFRLNRAIAEFTLLSFSEVTEDLLKSKRKNIKALYKKLLQEDESFKNSISLRTSDTDVLNYRIDFWMKNFKNEI